MIHWVRGVVVCQIFSRRLSGRTVLSSTNFGNNWPTLCPRRCYSYTLCVYSSGQYKVYVPYSYNDRCTERISLFSIMFHFYVIQFPFRKKRIFVEYLTFRFAFISQDDLHTTVKYDHSVRINSTSVEKKRVVVERLAFYFLCSTIAMGLFTTWRATKTLQSLGFF